MATDEHAATPLGFVVQPTGGTAAAPPAGRAILHVAGSRAELTRLASVVSALRAADVPQAIAVPARSKSPVAPLYDAAGLPRAERLAVRRRGSEAQRVADGLIAADELLARARPAMLVTSGDAPSTFALTLVASKRAISVARVGAGHRHGDFSAPGEIDRMLADHVAELLFTDGPDTAAKLHAEGVPLAHVHIVGSTAIDLARKWEQEARDRKAWRRFGVSPGGYVLAAFHAHPQAGVPALADALRRLAFRTPVVLVVDTATLDLPGPLREPLESAGVRICQPLPYLDFLGLQCGAASIVTDSAGVQEEASALGVRCFTVGRATDRTSTLTHGSNMLLGDDIGQIAEIGTDGSRLVSMTREFDDGRASARIAAVIARWLKDRSGTRPRARVAVG